MKKASILFISLLLLGFAVDANAQLVRERASFQWKNLPLRTAIDSLMHWYNEAIVFLDEDVDGITINASCNNCSFDNAVKNILNETQLMWVRRGSQVILKKAVQSENENLITISGVITDTLSGERIAGASIILNVSDSLLENKIKQKWCASNGFGYFSFPRVRTGSYKILVRAIGYVPQTFDLNRPIEKCLDIKLYPKEIVLNPVTIEGNRTALTSVDKFSRGSYRRSVPSDPNQYLLDGGRVYNPTHFGATLNTFYSETLTDVDILSGGLPPTYGSYIGGIVDYSLRNGSRQRLSGSIGIGSLNSQVSVEGHVFDVTTFLIAGRIGYPEKFMSYYSQGNVKPSDAGFQEVTAKVTHSLSVSEQLTLSCFYGQDKYKNSVDDGQDILNNNFLWRNKLINLRWSGIAASGFFMYANAVYSGYDFQLNHNLSNNSVINSNAKHNSNYAIEDWNISAHAENYFSDDHLLKGGAEFIYHTIKGNIDAFSTQIGFYNLQNYSSWETAVYLQDQWKITSNLLAELGARVTSYNAKDGNFSAVDPRFSLSLFFDAQTKTYASFSSIKQFLHPYNNSGVFVLYPAKFWYPSTENISPSNSLYSTLGIERSFAKDEFLLSTEAYYRITNNIYDFSIDTISLQTNNLEQYLNAGTGKAYGIQCNFRKRYGVMSGSINYTFSCLEKSIDVHNNKTTEGLLDRWHELQLYTSYSPRDNWTIGVLCVITSKRKPLSKSLFGVQEDYNIRNVTTVSTSRGQVQEYSNFIDVNGSRLPGFQRLELNISHQFALWHFLGQINLRFLNSYGITDPYKWQLYSYRGKTRWYVLLDEVKLFPLYPALEMLVRF